jgi:hypothetical protein
VKHPGPRTSRCGKSSQARATSKGRTCPSGLGRFQIARHEDLGFHKWYPIHSWMVKKSWYFMDIHECKWMRTGGTPILGNLHIYIYIYLFICLSIDMGSSRQRSSWFIMSFHWICVAKQPTQPTVPGLTPPTTSRNMISLVTCPSGSRSCSWFAWTVSSPIQKKNDQIPLILCLLFIQNDQIPINTH